MGEGMKNDRTGQLELVPFRKRSPVAPSVDDASLDQFVAFAQVCLAFSLPSRRTGGMQSIVLLSRSSLTYLSASTTGQPPSRRLGRPLG